MPRPVALQLGDGSEEGAGVADLSPGDHERRAREVLAHRVDLRDGLLLALDPLGCEQVHGVGKRPPRDRGEHGERRDVRGVAPCEPQHARRERNPTHLRPLAPQVALEILHKFLRGLVAVDGTLFEKPRDDDLEVAAKASVDATDRRGNLAADHSRRVGERSRAEFIGKLPAQRLVEHDADRVEVAARIDNLATRLLG